VTRRCLTDLYLSSQCLLPGISHIRGYQVKISLSKIRDVTKIIFEFDNIQTFNVSTDSKFDECFKCFVVKCEFMEKSLSVFILTVFAAWNLLH